MLVLATAGHVDHGKSALVAALTGTHPDRLKEEQLREMTIDLGFAYFDMPDGTQVGIIDVPGHVDFIENMLAGMGGIDGVIVVIAADEGIMPQTREHLAIIDLLEIQQGVVVLTKADLANDPEWLALLEAEIRIALTGLSLANAPIVRVSARTGTGITALVEELQKFSKAPHVLGDDGKTPRLPIDRVFSIQGFGTVVTGTLLEGSLATGDEVALLPGNAHSRIRGLQSDKRKIQSVSPGSRVAVNLASLSKDEIARGDVLVKPDIYTDTSLVDVSVRLLPGELPVLKHNQQVKFFTGTARRLARVRTLAGDDLHAGAKGYLQLELDEPVCVKTGDHFILRSASPARTLGGGVILDPHPKSKYKLRDAATLERLTLLHRGSLEELLLSAASLPVTSTALSRQLKREEREVSAACSALVQQGRLRELGGAGGGNQLVISTGAFVQLAASLQASLEKLHAAFPGRVGFRFAEVAKDLRVDEDTAHVLLKALVHEGQLKHDGKVFSLPGWQLAFSPAQEKALSRLCEMIDANPFTPPTYQEASDLLGQELLRVLIENGQMVRISPEIIFRQKEYASLVACVDDLLAQGKSITIIVLKETFKTSRKYAVPFLEHMDRIKKTRRVGDERVGYSA